MNRKLVLLTVVFVLATLATASADSIVGVTTRTGNDTVDWGQLGAPGTTIPNPFNATSVGGVGVTGSFAGTTGVTAQQGTNWFGNFAPGDNLVWTNFPGQGPLTLSFNAGLTTVGFQIQSDFYGTFTAKIDSYNGNTLLGSFSENGVSNANGDNSAIYIGVLDQTGPNINKIVVSISGTSDNGDFAINKMSLTKGQTGVPEPGSLLLLASGVLGLAGTMRRRFLN